jgi:hypothetical protein
MKSIIKKLIFYWVTSFTLAVALYYVLWAIMPIHYVFGAPYRMFLYHWEHPLAFISIPCFFYSFIATVAANHFSRLSVLKQIWSTAAIITLTIIMSSPLGGMLWHYYDMEAGFFPQNWLEKIIIQGSIWGFELGWLIVFLSIPYNIIGSVICYFLTKKGSELFDEKPTQQENLQSTKA